MRNRAGQVLVATLLAVSSFLDIAEAQAYYGTLSRELASCGSDNFMYLGCFPNFETQAGNQYFPFDPQGYNPPGPSRSFPGWDPNSNYNNTVTPLDCSRVCRGFGYKFASLRDNSCRCGIQLPANYLSGPDTACNVPCKGDQRQTCGGGSDAQIYLDPTFAANAQVPIPVPVANGNPSIANYYQYLGCFFTPEGFPTQDSRANTLRPTIQDCLNYCAGLGYAYAYGYAEGSSTRCNCGTSLGFRSYRSRPELMPSPGDCNTTCGVATPGTCDISTQKCCGRNNFAPIYINPELQGCYQPIIPGYKASETDAQYECYNVPPSLLGPPKALPTSNFNPALLITSGPALIRPPSVTAPNGQVYLLYGCYGSPAFLSGGINGVLVALTSATYLNIVPATLDRCAALCSGANYPVFGMTNGR
ncbi:WSC domain-containing protein 1, partial [Cladorrhinum samala]